MNKSVILNRVSVFALVATLAVPTLVSADMIGLGLRWGHGVYIQEYWQQGRPYYLIANANDRAVSVRAASWSANEGTGATLAEWRVEQNAFGIFDVSNLLNNNYLEVSILDGPRLGLMGSPVSPGYSTDIISGVGVNGSGGRPVGVSFHQERIEFARGDRVDISLRIRPGTGTLRLDKTQTCDPRRPENYQIPHAYLENVVSATAPIQITDTEIIIDASAASASVDTHEVKLEYRIPKDTKGPLVMIAGWRVHLPMSSHGLTRGIAVQPN